MCHGVKTLTLSIIDAVAVTTLKFTRITTLLLLPDLMWAVTVANNPRDLPHYKDQCTCISGVIEGLMVVDFQLAGYLVS